MIWCETDQNDYPDREFFTERGVLMHRPRQDRPHPAVPALEYQVPDVGDAFDAGREE